MKTLYHIKFLHDIDPMRVSIGLGGTWDCWQEFWMWTTRAGLTRGVIQWMILEEHIK